MASVARLMTLFHKLEIFPRVFWPKLYRHQLLLHYPLSQQKFICSFCASFPSRQYSTFKILFKKHDTAKDEKVPKKKAAVSKDEKTVQVFDESGLFVGKQKLWKAKADAAKKNLRLLEMNGSTKSKKKDKADSDDDTEESDIMSYKLVSVEEFMEKINEVKAQKAKAEKLRHIVIKSNIDKGGLDIKISQIKDILKKKGKVKIAIQTYSVNGGQVAGGRPALVATLKKVNSELLGISTVQEATSQENKIIIVATAKDTYLNGENKGDLVSEKDKS